MSLAAEFPPTEKHPMTDEYHGVKVTDDYRWLEEANSPAVKDWTAEQNRRTRAYLDALPDRAAIQAQLTEWYAKVSPGYGMLTSRPGRVFALKTQPPKQQRLLVMLKSADEAGSDEGRQAGRLPYSSEMTILDPNELDPKGQVSIDWYVPSPDGRLVAMSLSENGSEDGALHFYETDTGKALADAIPHVQYPTAGGHVAWAPDGKSVYYTRFPRKGERPEADLNFYQQIYVHRLGTPEATDVYSLGKEFPRIAEILLSTSRSGRWLLVSVANGDGGEYSHYVRDLRAGDQSGDSEWRQITRFADGVKQVEIGCDDMSLYLRSVKDAPRGKVLKMALRSPTLGTAPLQSGPTLGTAPLQGMKDAAVIVPEGEAVIEDFVVTGSYLYVSELVGGPSRVRRFDLEGKNATELRTPANSGAGNLVALEDRPEDDRVLFRESSYVEPEAWYLCEPAQGGGEGKVAKTALARTSPVDFSDIEVRREFATSKDGTKVPVNIVCRKGTKLDGHNPALLTAYGGYGHSMRPEFSFVRRLWFDRGCVWVQANIRGGGEYGEAWHFAGNLTHKQNCFDDFAACAQHLMARGYTEPARLAVEGGSNGGLLMGAFLTQHPDLARAVVSHVGIYDMLRVELDPNGAFNVTEFGTVKDPEQFKAIYAYSPYHHVVDGAKYAAVFFLAGETDGRVNPANSRKMTARLQAATGSGRPILLRLSGDSGHGMGTALSERIAQEAEVFAFLFEELGVRP
jgi:prolyl oligopeptidase